MKKFNSLMMVAGLAAFATPAFAGGYQINEMATRASGMGNAFTAVADDASAAWHNPAGTGFTQEGQVMGGGLVLLVPGAKYSSNAASKGVGGAAITASTQAASNSFFVPHGYATYMHAPTGLGFTLGINSPFGLETSWPTTVPFASKTTFSRIQMLMVNPSLVYRISDNLSIAGGADYANIRKVDLNSSNQLLHGTGNAWGGNAALMYRDGPFSFGINYRSRIKIGIDGTATSQATLASLGAGVSAATTSLTLPDQINVGAAWRPQSDWLLSADVDWVNWKTFDRILINYTSATYRARLSTLQGAVGAPVTGNSNIARNWKATVAFKLGAEWTYTDQIRTRFGYVFDPTPSNDLNWSPSIPDNDRHIISFGVGYDINQQATLDLLYGYVYFTKRNQTASATTPAGSPESVVNGSYKSQVHMLAASINYRF